MPIIWDTKLETGIEVIDAQHQRIVEYINDLEIAKMKLDKKMVNDIIEQLIDYTQSHFGFEEEMLEDAGYKFLKPHKKVHELFIRRVTDFTLRFRFALGTGFPDAFDIFAAFSLDIPPFFSASYILWMLMGLRSPSRM